VIGDRPYHRFVMGSADFEPYGLDSRVPRKKETPILVDDFIEVNSAVKCKVP
jgi:hypothetical protein